MCVCLIVQVMCCPNQRDLASTLPEHQEQALIVPDQSLLSSMIRLPTSNKFLLLMVWHNDLFWNWTQLFPMPVYLLPCVPPSNRSSFCSSFYPFIHPSLSQINCPLIQWFCLFIQLFIFLLSIHLSVHLFGE
jgi:hypothetical protein